MNDIEITLNTYLQVYTQTVRDIQNSNLDKNTKEYVTRPYTAKIELLKELIKDLC